MTDPLDAVFVDRAPPPGGLARLRARLDAQERRPRWQPAVAGLALAVAVVVLWLGTAPTPLTVDDPLVLAALGRTPTIEPVVVLGGDVGRRAAPSTGEGVVFYEIARVR